MLVNQNCPWRRSGVIKTLIKAVATVALAATSAPAAHAAIITLRSPYGLAVDQNSGLLYIADPASAHVFTFNPDTRALSLFAASVPNVFSVAVNNDGLVYSGVVGASSQINVYNPQAHLITTLPVPPGDSPITMTFDANNILYQASGFGRAYMNLNQINVYTNDFSDIYNKSLQPGNTVLYPYNQYQSYTAITAGTIYALAYDDGQIFVIGTYGSSSITNNIYDTQALLSGHAADLAKTVGGCPDPGCTNWLKSHWLALTESGFAAAVDAHHNIFYTDPDNNNVVVASKSLKPIKLLTGLSSQPFGVAFDKTRSLLYVAFPEEHLVRAYKVTYATQNGAQRPTLRPLGDIR
jgi:hypothetical protein